MRLDDTPSDRRARYLYPQAWSYRRARRSSAVVPIGTVHRGGSVVGAGARVTRRRPLATPVTIRCPVPQYPLSTARRARPTYATLLRGSRPVSVERVRTRAGCPRSSPWNPMKRDSDDHVRLPQAGHCSKPISKHASQSKHRARRANGKCTRGAAFSIGLRGRMTTPNRNVDAMTISVRISSSWAWSQALPWLNAVQRLTDS